MTVAFGVAAQLLRSVVGVTDLDDAGTREHIRNRFPGAEPDDLLLVADLVGLANADTALADISPDARRRRLTRLFQSASLSRQSPALFIVEDVHWIDDASESMLADFIEVVPQTRSMVLMTWRSEYDGALARVPNSQRIVLGSLSNAQSAALTAELLGADPSVADLERLISAQADGNPFFAQEIVRDLAERHGLSGEPGAYVSRCSVDDIEIPDTLHAAIASRIDRLGAAAKLMLNAAAVIGTRFGEEDLTDIIGDTSLDDLVQAQLIDPVMVTPRAEYAFHHPLIRSVAYESQLKSQRAQLHRRVAAAIERRAGASADANAALIAEHLEAAGDLRGAYSWHMRAGAWLIYRDINAARDSWQRGRQVADLVPVDDPDRLSMRIAPRTLLCGSTWRVGGDVADTGFRGTPRLVHNCERQDLVGHRCGLLIVLMFHGEYDELPQLTSEYVDLVESVSDPTLTVALHLWGHNRQNGTCPRSVRGPAVGRACDRTRRRRRDDGQPPPRVTAGHRPLRAWCVPYVPRTSWLASRLRRSCRDRPSSRPEYLRNGGFPQVRNGDRPPCVQRRREGHARQRRDASSGRADRGRIHARDRAP